MDESGKSPKVKILEVLEALDELAQSYQRYRSYYVRDILTQCRDKLEAAIKDQSATD